MIDEVDRIIENYTGYNWNRQQLIETAIREKITAMRLITPFKPRFEHFNCYEEHVTIIDNELDGKWINVYFRDDPFCEVCERKDCDHVRFALSLPKVVKTLTEHGWVVEDGKVLKKPF